MLCFEIAFEYSNDSEVAQTIAMHIELGIELEPEDLWLTEAAADVRNILARTREAM